MKDLEMMNLLSGADVIRYVEANLEVALNAESSSSRKISHVIKDEFSTYNMGVNVDFQRDLAAKAIYEKTLSDPEYKKELINLITVYAIKNSQGSFKLNLNKDVMETVFMRKIKQFLHPANIRLLALSFDKDIEVSKVKGRSN